MITILTGAIKNVGDYLIGHRAKELLKEFVTKDILEISRFESLEPYLDQVNQSSCLILCGGPAYANNLYPGIYPLVDNISKINVPIIPFALGWSGKPIGQPLKFKFNQESKDFLRAIHAKINYSTCRDIQTLSVIKNHGIENVKVSGDPAWYHIPSFNKNFEIKKEIKKIVITTPAHQALSIQTNKLVSYIRKNFPDSKIFLTYHRGIYPLIDAPPRKGLSYLHSAIHGIFKGAKPMDVSGNLDNISFYTDCDLHVGYRVHAHLFFLSKRKPSILINEDGRGEGMSVTLKQEPINAKDQNIFEKIDAEIQKIKSIDTSSFDKTRAVIDSTFKDVMLPNLMYIKSLIK